MNNKGVGLIEFILLSSLIASLTLAKVQRDHNTHESRGVRIENQN